MTESRFPEDTEYVEEIVQQHLQDIDDFELIVQQFIMNSLEEEARSNKEPLMVHRGKKLTVPMVYAAAKKYFENNQTMSEQEQHTVRLVNSGSWSVDYTMENGEIDASPRYSFHVELMAEAECSCGQRFDNEEQAIEHLREQEQSEE